jgi:hypothetical protein
MSDELDLKTDPGQPMVYQIRIKGHLGCQWTDWFGGLTVTLEGNGDTLLTGPVVDQAALHGLLKKVRDLGMPLLSVNPVEPGQADKQIRQMSSGKLRQATCSTNSKEENKMKAMSKAKSGISSMGSVGTFLKVGT